VFVSIRLLHALYVKLFKYSFHGSNRLFSQQMNTLQFDSSYIQSLLWCTNNNKQAWYTW